MNVFVQLFKSLYSPRDISLTRFQGIGKTILYVFILALVSIIPTSIYFTYFTNEALTNMRTIIAEELPTFSIEDGKLSSDIKEPLEIEKGDFLLYFDSTNEITVEELSRNQDTFALLTNEFVIITPGNVQSTPYSMLQGYTFNNEVALDLIDAANSMKYIFIPIIIILIYLFAAGLLFIKVSIFAYFGTVIAGSLQRKLQYKQSWRITSYSLTLSTVFFAIMELLQTSIPGAAFLDWIVILIMLYLSIKEMPQKKIKN